MNKDVNVDDLVENFVNSMITNIVDKALHGLIGNADVSQFNKNFVESGGVIIIINKCIDLLSTLHSKSVYIVDRILTNHLMITMNSYMESNENDVITKTYTPNIVNFSRFIISILALFKDENLDDFKKQCSINFSDDDIQNLMTMKRDFIKRMSIGVTDMNFSEIKSNADKFSGDVATFFTTHGK